MAAIVPRTSGYILPHWSGHKCSQVFVESVSLLFKSMHRLIAKRTSDFMTQTRLRQTGMVDDFEDFF